MKLYGMYTIHCTFRILNFKFFSIISISCCLKVCKIIKCEFVHVSHHLNILMFIKLNALKDTVRSGMNSEQFEIILSNLKHKSLDFWSLICPPRFREKSP